MPDQPPLFKPDPRWSMPPAPPPPQQNTSYPPPSYSPPRYQQPPIYPQQQPYQMYPPPYQRAPKKKGLPVWAIILIVLLVMGGIGGILRAFGLVKDTTGDIQPTTQATSIVDVQPTDPPTPTPKPVQHWNIGVTSEIVKHINGQYRYFFDVRNHDKKPWSGSVTIELYNDKQETPLGTETFSTTSPMQPGLGSVVYFDIYTGPPNVAGEYGITHFKYTAHIDDAEIASGGDKITTSYEDLGV